MKRKRIAFVIAALLIVTSAGVYFYYGFLFKEARDIASERPDFSITAAKLLEEYNANPQKADALYLNKTIELTGTVTKKTAAVIILEKAVFCLFSEKIKVKQLQSTVTIKGKCIGYDELFQEVKIDQCTLNNPNN